MKKEQSPIEINGRIYPMWSQFVHQKDKWVGGILTDIGDPMDRRMGYEGATTKIADVKLIPNGDDSAIFTVKGEDFTCSGDVQHLGVSPTRIVENGITFSGYMNHQWAITPRKGWDEG